MGTFYKGQRIELVTTEGAVYGRYAGQVNRGDETYIAIDSVSPKVAGWYKKSEITKIL